jgi:addiction module HigA family antidote
MEYIKLAVRLPANRRPTSPGEMLLEEFLKPLGMSQTELAQRIGVSYVRVNELVNGKRRVTPDTAFRLGRLFNMSAEFWMNGQLACDVWDALHSPAMAEIEKIEPMPKGRIYEEGEDDEPAEQLAAD